MAAAREERAAEAPAREQGGGGTGAWPPLLLLRRRRAVSLVHSARALAPSLTHAAAPDPLEETRIRAGEGGPLPARVDEAEAAVARSSASPRWLRREVAGGGGQKRRRHDEEAEAGGGGGRRRRSSSCRSWVEMGWGGGEEERSGVESTPSPVNRAPPALNRASRHLLPFHNSGATSAAGGAGGGQHQRAASGAGQHRWARRCAAGLPLLLRRRWSSLSSGRGGESDRWRGRSATGGPRPPASFCVSCWRR